MTFADTGSTTSFERVNVEATAVTQIDLLGDLDDDEWLSILEVRTDVEKNNVLGLRVLKGRALCINARKSSAFTEKALRVSKICRRNIQDPVTLPN